MFEVRNQPIGPNAADIIHGKTLAGLAEETTAVEAVPLFERIGGHPAVEWIVDCLVENMLADQRLRTTLASVDVAALKRSQAGFISEALGGPLPTSGRPLEGQAHFDGADHSRVILHFHNATLSLDLSSELQNELILAIAAHALAVVGR